MSANICRVSHYTLLSLAFQCPFVRLPKHPRLYRARRVREFAWGGIAIVLLRVAEPRRASELARHRG
ncbi:hypothetical protein BG60_07135 [Caballeronia zhejiangensis]|uniref:Uncharacterized protein n=1 Tax=Caballeronia zhejiangensis TaxID=871203 RepID=A0A656QHN8_9BURK|nr:hypothetical protein BURK_035749 [Burkholderia sp. SJ98]KDR29520.1 hypothetical protein BG60_07135 [Caballeronia zhejiangensis]